MLPLFRGGIKTEPFRFEERRGNFITLHPEVQRDRVYVRMVPAVDNANQAEDSTVVLKKRRRVDDEEAYVSCMNEQCAISLFETCRDT